MLRFGMVTFYRGGEESADLKKLLVERMNEEGVITVSEMDIKNWYEEDLKDPNPVTHQFALHNRKEVRAFKTIAEGLHIQDQTVVWKVTLFEPDPKMCEWTKGVEKRRKEEKKNGKRKKV